MFFRPITVKMPKGKGGSAKKGGGASASGSKKSDDTQEAPRASAKGGTSVKASFFHFRTNLAKLLIHEIWLR